MNNKSGINSKQGVNSKQSLVRKFRWKLFLPLLLGLAFSITLYYSLSNNPYYLGLVQKDKSLPDFVAQDLMDSTNSISKKDLSGNIVLLNVWASWCATCKTEHEFLLELSTQPELSLYGINYRDQQQKAINVLEQTGNPYKRVIFDPQGRLAMELGVYGTPITYLIDKNGIILFRYSGALNKARWQELFVPIIEKIKQD